MTDMRSALDSDIQQRRTGIAKNQQIATKIEGLLKEGMELGMTAQCRGESWNTCTRPVEKNGFNGTVREARAQNSRA